MSDNILPSEESYVNATPDEVYRWADRAGETGILNPTTAKLKVTALKRVLTVLADDEQLGARAILNALDALVNRLARKEGGNPDTLSTYKQRAESLLRDFIEYHHDPLAFQARGAEKPVKGSPEKKKRDAGKAPPAAPPPAPVETQQEGAQPAGRRYIYPLGDGREFEYVLPRSGLSMREVKKVALLLISLANDYEPNAATVAEETRKVRTAGQIEQPDVIVDGDVTFDQA